MKETTINNESFSERNISELIGENMLQVINLLREKIRSSTKIHLKDTVDSGKSLSLFSDHRIHRTLYCADVCLFIHRKYTDGKL